MKEKEIGQNIRSYRIRAGLTQEQLAEKANLSVSYISQIETGVKTVSLKTLYDVAEVLDTSAQSLLAGEDAGNAERVTAVLAECAPWEQSVILEIAQATRNSLRKHKVA